MKFMEIIIVLKKFRKMENRKKIKSLCIVSGSTVLAQAHMAGLGWFRPNPTPTKSRLWIKIERWPINFNFHIGPCTIHLSLSSLYLTPRFLEFCADMPLAHARHTEQGKRTSSSDSCWQQGFRQRGSSVVSILKFCASMEGSNMVGEVG